MHLPWWCHDGEQALAVSRIVNTVNGTPAARRSQTIPSLLFYFIFKWLTSKIWLYWFQHLGCWGQHTSRIQNKEVYATMYSQVMAPMRAARQSQRVPRTSSLSSHGAGSSVTGGRGAGSTDGVRPFGNCYSPFEPTVPVV